MLRSLIVEPCPSIELLLMDRRKLLGRIVSLYEHGVEQRTNVNAILATDLRRTIMLALSDGDSAFVVARRRQIKQHWNLTATPLDTQVGVLMENPTPSNSEP